MNHHDLVTRLTAMLNGDPAELRGGLRRVVRDLRDNHEPHMGERHYDVAKREWVDRPLPCGLQTAISWTRLVDELRRSGEFRADERIAHLEVGANGISFHLETGR